MIDRLLDLLTGRAAPALKDSADQLQLAVAALLIEAGRMDGKFDEVERGTIERLLTESSSSSGRQYNRSSKRLGAGSSTRRSTFTSHMRSARALV